MLTIRGHRQCSYCDGLTRRSFLTVGALGLAGPTLADLLRLKAQGAVPSAAAHKAIILVYLGGGPSHIDMYDMKPDAPVGIRGEFKPIRTNVSGMEICEHMPLQAKIADKLAIVRGVATTNDGHNAHVVLTGVPTTVRRPPIGALVSRVREGTKSTMPPYVSLMPQDHNTVRGSEEPEWAGASHRPFVIDGPGLDNLTLSRDVSLDRLHDRTALLRGFDHLQRDLGNTGALAGADAFTARALEMVTTGKVREAFDLTREPLRVRDKYGPNASQFLLARRLVEAGTSVVTLSYFGGMGSNGWDTHANNFPTLKRIVPEFDRAMYALVTDLAERGLDRDVAVMACGEMGREPLVGTVERPGEAGARGGGGRAHWTPAGFALFAGGGLKMGQVVGDTNRLGERARGRPFKYFNVLATLYHVLGIDPCTTILDPSGRPQYLLDEHEPIAGLV